MTSAPKAPRSINRRLLVLGLAAVLLGGCSQGSDPPAPARDAVQSPTPAATATPVPQATSTPEPAPWETPPVAAADPAALAEQLVTAERAIRSPAVEGPELAWMGHLQQIVYRTLVERPEWHDEFLAALPEDVRPLAAANLNAGSSLRAMVSPGEGLPPWRIVEPAPLEELLSHYRAAEEEFGVPWSYLAAIHLVETFSGRIRGTSVAGAQGPMQFIPATWAAFGEGDVNDDRDAIMAAARYLVASGAPGDMAAALYSYNPSELYVRAVTGYAELMEADPDAYRGYYHWQAYFLTVDGDTHLPIGFTN